MALNITGLDGVRVTLSAAITDTAVTIPISAALSPYKTPPDPLTEHYYLTLVDFTNRPGAWERVQVTAKTGSNLTVVRNIASSTGSGIAFSSGSVIQWTVGVEDIQESGGGGGGFFCLAAGGLSNAYIFDNDSSSPEYMSVTQYPISVPPTFDRDIKWYNTTGADLTISELSVYLGYSGGHSGTFTVTVQKNSADTLLAVDIPTGQVGSAIYRDSTNSFVLPDGDYITYRITTDTASQLGYMNISTAQIKLSA